MSEMLMVYAMALWLGILTSISPCPLATNIAAISYIGRRVGTSRQVLFSGLLYTFGRVVTYTVLAVLLVTSILSVPQMSLFLQKYMNLLLGPILILTGMFLLELIRVRMTGQPMGQQLQRRADSWGIWGAALLGIVFSLSLCPVSAALFFGSLVPLSLKTGSSVMLPVLYGIGSGLPVLLFAFFIAFGAKSLGKAFNRLTNVEFWARRVTGLIFIFVGSYYCLMYIFHVL